MSASLNEQQKKAVSHKEGPLLILAGAGAGKTRVITHRIQHLIERGVDPSQILAVTFTNKAAKEMRERVHALLAQTNSMAQPFGYHEGPFVSTFHALGVHILRENARTIGLKRSFSIFDRGDSLRAIKEAMQRVDVNPKEFEPRKVLGALSRAKGEGLTLTAYEEDAHDFFPRLVARVWGAYQHILKNEKALDFDDLLVRTTHLLKDNELIRRSYQERWHYVHIDEYQDTNKVQCELAGLLAAPHNNICVVGDIDQNIYSWRGADVDNILSFERIYPNAPLILLEENYRSTQTILDASNTIIKKNKRRKEKRLFTKNDAGEKIALAALYDEMDEARFVAKTAAEHIENGVEPKDIAVLYRANFQSRALEEAFLMYDVPYQVLGVRFFERKEVKDVLSFIRAALNRESWSDIKRVVNVPPRGIGKVTFLKMASRQEEKIAGKTREKVADFWKLLDRIEATALAKKPSETIAFVLKETGLEEVLKKGTEDDLERLLNIKELAALSARYDDMPPQEGIEKLLEEAALASDQDELKENKNAVKLMTVHASKGLEFGIVFITGLEEGLFPHQSLSEDRIDDEEERRLFYVALTRAKRKVYLSYTSVRTIFGSREVNILSEFITDIDDEHMEILDREEDTNRTVIYID